MKKKLNKRRVTQIEALRMIDSYMGRAYVDFISANPLRSKLQTKYRSKMIFFSLTFYLKNGSVMADVFLDQESKLR